MTAPLFSKTRMQYETPREGITIGGYVARRLHKTVLLKPVPDFLKDDSARALAQIALYAAAASTSFGPAMYQPDSDPEGAAFETRDPETNARVVVTYQGNLRFSYRVELDGVGTLSGVETITGTTVGLRGLGMPAPTTFKFAAAEGNYHANIMGIITSELAQAWAIGESAVSARSTSRTARAIADGLRLIGQDWSLFRSRHQINERLM